MLELIGGGSVINGATPSSFMDNLVNYSAYLSPHYQNIFISKLDFLFSVLGFMVSKNICKLRNKLKNSKNLPELTWS